jgi:ribosomal protein L35
LLTHKNRKRKRKLRKEFCVSDAHSSAIKRMMPNS